MALISLKEILQDGRAGKYAVPMFDVSNPVMIRIAVEVAEEENSPVILAAIEPDLVGNNIHYWAQAAQLAALRSNIPVAFMVDHAASLELCLRCAEAGFSGVMIDASSKEFSENARITREVCDLMHRRGVSVEAELGHVGDAQAGEGEGALTGDHSAASVFTEPDKVEEFVELSRCDALAVSIGTAHGVYRTAPTLNIELLRQINAISPVPLVLHGGSGTPDDQIRNAIANGIAKINICSEIMHAWHHTLLEVLQKAPNLSFWNCTACVEPEKAMREVMRRKIRLFGSNRG
ncbi:MAG: ketose-bisphosphate aldolase [Victivallaceae bacterium]